MTKKGRLSLFCLVLHAIGVRKAQDTWCAFVRTFESVSPMSLDVIYCWGCGLMVRAVCAHLVYAHVSVMCVLSAGRCTAHRGSPSTGTLSGCVCLFVCASESACLGSRGGCQARACWLASTVLCVAGPCCVWLDRAVCDWSRAVRMHCQSTGMLLDCLVMAGVVGHNLLCNCPEVSVAVLRFLGGCVCPRWLCLS